MRKTTTDIGTRRDVTERVETHRETLEKKGVDLEKIGKDVAVIRDVLAHLDFSGTQDGADEVKKNMNGAEDVAEGEYDKDTTELDDKQRESEEYEGKLGETRETAERDENKISAAVGRVEFQRAVEQMERGRETLLRELDFLGQQVERAHQAREKSERLQAELDQTRRQERRPQL